MTYDKANDLCLSGTVVPVVDSKSGLHFIYSGGLGKDFLFLCHEIHTELYIMDRRYLIHGKIFPAC